MSDRSPLDKVLVVIPTYNEAENIESIVNRLHTANPTVHVLIADDNSPDGTGAIADRLAESDDRVHVMHRAGKQGLGAAYLAGFDWGLEHGYDAIVEMDADGSHQPEQLPSLLAALADADMVKGSRYVKGGSTVNWPVSRKLISRGGSLWSAAVLGLPLRDVTGGFNAFRASTLRAIDLDEIASAGYCFQIDLAWRTHKKGLKITEVPIEFVEREFGESKMNRAIVIEAMIRTTLWGLDHRAKQLAGAAGKAADKAKELRK
ncbi:polyprenol monophosphomannose synthase [Aestuariimicrobium ganziense]|uniref:polyprenol monophosphomannose synthase n=1 Tax=Aestuariimicrobium ganziense TaxID=2773677 RepID=UPI001943381D|nr:polyprenol monophosphomannose synthase [Aestuariimicrobium ganziense]